MPRFAATLALALIGLVLFGQGAYIHAKALVAQVPGAKISVCHGVGGMFAASGTVIFTNER